MKETPFDSKEEECLYNILVTIPDVLVCPHQQLRDVFMTNDTLFSMKLSYMHCDFIIRDKQYKILCGVEIDGNQHRTDQEQIANDSMKNNFFMMNNTPLLRFKAAEVRESAETVSKKIQDKIKERMDIVDEAQTEKQS